MGGGGGGESSGPLAAVGAAMGKVVAIEQNLSMAFNAVAAVLPSFPAVRITDMDIGLPHAHSHPPNLVPPAPPVPLPSTGPVIPIPIFSGASKTQINGLPAARCGDMGLGIWCGGYFPMYEIFLGSSNVWIEGARAARIGVDITKHCVFTSPKPSDPPLGPMVGFTVTASSNVLIGGVPMPSLMAMGMAGAFKALGKLVGAGARALRRLGQRLGRNMRPGFIKCRILRAEPVNTVTGEVVVDQQDFSLPGRIPLTWNRHYGSHTARTGVCGYGWETVADARLEFETDGAITFYDGGPGASVFLSMPTTESVLALVDGARLSKSYDSLTVLTKEGLSYHFRRSVGSPKEILVEKITDRCGNFWRFLRRSGDLYEIQESAGRRIEVKSRGGRIEQMALVHPDLEQPHVFVRYHYDEAGDLITVYDALNAPYRFAYKDHCLIKHTDRNGLSFYYEYDGDGPEAKCVHSYGDGGLYNYHFEYLQTVGEHLDLLGETRITDSLGNVARLQYDERQLVLREVDPLGGVTKYEYDEVGRTSTVIEPGQQRTEYYYDDFSNLVKVVRPDGMAILTDFDENSQLIAITDPNGQTWRQEWDHRGLLLRQVSPTGSVTTYDYDKRGYLTAITNPLGAVTRLAHDRYGNVTSLVDALGYATRFVFDGLGNLAGRIDPLGKTIAFHYDAKSRFVRRVSPSGISVECGYDPQDNLNFYRDEAGYVTRLKYSGLAELTRRYRPDGTSIKYQYDTEERLIGITNERGETFHLRRDPLGRLTEEVDYWGQSRKYEYDLSGLLRQSTDALGRVVGYKFDKLGRLTAKLLPDRTTEAHTYDPIGNLIATSNAYVSIRRVFDPEGRVLQEHQGNFDITNTYDLNGNRVRRATSHGNTVTYEYDPTDQVTAIRINKSAPIHIERNALGQITTETLAPGFRRTFRYNADGFLIQQRAHTVYGALHSQDFEYDRGGNLTRRTDSKLGVETFLYDPMGRVREHTNPEGRIQRYLHDPAGDLLRFRIEHEGSSTRWERVAQSNGFTCRFDAAGNLAERCRSNDSMTFIWDSNNLLIRSESSNASATTYGYDTQGRRAFKQTNGKRTEFQWDGDVLLQVRPPDVGPREFVYYPDTFKPLAVIESDQRVHYYHNDPNGVPRELTDAAGRVIWSASYTATGGVERLHVAEIDNPLRLQGQYFDSETGLSYNRYRYYDEIAGAFVSQDPLGLAVGENPYHFGPNVWAWIDPLGLACGPAARLDARGRWRDAQGRFSGPPRSAGSTGRSIPADLREAIVLRDAQSGAGAVIPGITMTDPRWPASAGWVKMRVHQNGVEVHYVKNTITGAVDDFKFK